MDDHVQKEEATDIADQLPIVEDSGIRRTVRDFPPAHYLFKINSFSALAKTKEEVCECGTFEAGGYKWKLLLYPKGDKSANGCGFISLYLEIVETQELQAWEVNVIFKLFVMDQIRDKYLTVEGADGAVRRFHKLKTKWGFSNFHSMESFSQPANGYLMDDCCVFGAEVSVFKRNMNVVSFSIIEPPSGNGTLSWKIENFSKLDKEFYYSDVFTLEKLKWRLKVYPKGNSDQNGKALSVYLELDTASMPSPAQKQYAEFTLCVRSQAAKSQNNGRKLRNWFSTTNQDWGFTKFMTLKELWDSSSGYIMNDTLIVEAEFHIIWKYESS